MKHFREALRLEPNLEWARVGIIEAMKARFFLYRWLLSWFLWLLRFPPNVRFGLMLGLVFGRSLLANLIQMVPILAPLALPLTIGYMLFVWMTWTASSLFNLVLRLDSFGRLVLNPTERRESTLVGICLVLGIVVGLTSFSFDPRLASQPLLVGTLYLGLMLPLIATFQQPAGRKTWFAVYTAGVAACILMTTYLALNYCYQVTSLSTEPKLNEARLCELKSLFDSSAQWFGYSAWGIVLSTWIGAGLNLNPVRE